VTTSGPIIGTVETVIRYPVKSMLGETLDAGTRIGGRGLTGDRIYALVDATDRLVASAKNPRKWGRLLTCHAALVDEPTAEQSSPMPAARITLSDGTITRSDDDAVDDVLSRELGRPVRLIGQPPAEAHYEDVWPDVDGVAPAEFIAQTRVTTDDPSETTSRFKLALAAPPGTFFDVAPVHLLTTASLQRAGQLYESGRFAVARFRPNLVIRTPPGAVDFLENEWVSRRLRIGDRVVLQVTLRVPRCVMTTLPQGDLPSDLGILRTLANHNRVEFGRLGRWACLGVYGSVVQPGVVRPGDSVVLE